MGAHKWRTATSRADKIAKYRSAHERMMAGDGFIYVAKVPRRPLVKIGFSLNPEHRVLQAAYPVHGKLRLLAKVAGTIRSERDLHRALRPHAKGREIYPASILCHPAIPQGLRDGAAA